MPEVWRRPRRWHEIQSAWECGARCVLEAVQLIRGWGRDQTHIEAFWPSLWHWLLLLLLCPRGRFTLTGGLSVALAGPPPLGGSGRTRPQSLPLEGGVPLPSAAPTFDRTRHRVRPIFGLEAIDQDVTLAA